MQITKENYDYVQKGFSILLNSLSVYVCKQLKSYYRSDWWDVVLDKLRYDRILPSGGPEDKLINSLDIANCIRLINTSWREVFSKVLSKNCHSYVNELMGQRNIVSHIGRNDLDLRMAERTLDNMCLLCKEVNPVAEKQIRAIYDIVRAKSVGKVQPTVVVSKHGGLLDLVGTDTVQKTDLTRKVTFGGKTAVYPVYKVKLDALYYNDQNDRIATWISKYESENGEGSLAGLPKDIFNGVIEGFVCDSNPEAMEKTQKNIELVGQREPGVTLADGRVVDGNRRFTCMRKIEQETQQEQYFETVIMDVDIQNDKKQIKLLELAVQHGEEKKVEYDLIDYAIGTYRDVVLTKLLTVDEYAQSTNESVSDVKARIEIVEIVEEFLNYLRLPNQYYVAREYQVYSLFQEMMTPLRKLQTDEEKQLLKKIAFNNALMKAMPDQRKFIRDIKGLINGKAYTQYFEDQKGIGDEISNLFSKANIRTKDDVDAFATDNNQFVAKLQNSLEKALLRYRAITLKNKPADNVSKGIDLLLDIDVRLFDKLDDAEKGKLKTALDEMKSISEKMSKML